jgi:hypothetical protein
VTIRTPDSTDHGDRSRVYRWAIGESTTNGEPDGGTTFVELSIYHDGDRKRFTASVGRVDVHDRGDGITSTRFGLLAGAGLPSEPVARFSAKRIDAFTTATLAALPEHASTNERVANVLGPVCTEGL